MGFPKYLEDNLKIIEERLALRQKENDPTPTYRATQKVSSKICDVTNHIVKITPKAPKKHKKKKKNIVCCHCGKKFFFTRGEQNFYKKHKLSEPKRCPDCRQKRKEMFEALKKNEEV